ncbi:MULTISPECIES: hypothetical protein [Crateriforma]|uniref:hypothetical protein n=1 Tax=Crateriforma TaxID=2714592 RepID=UPI0011B4EA81|nr:MULTISPECIES: hypothetical protein [Crateriforma]
MPLNLSKPKAAPTTPPTAAGIDVAQPQHGVTPALAASLALHFFLMVAIGFALVRRSKGTGGPPDREIGIAVVQRMPDRDRYTDAAELQTEPTPDASTDASSSSSAAPPAEFAPPIDMAGVLKQLTEDARPVTGTGLAGESNVDGDDLAGDNGKGRPQNLTKKKASLFGVSGFGSRFVYVMDRSDSMNGHGGRPLKAAKSELLRSLGTLSELQQFQIVFYNDKPTAFQSGGSVQLIQGQSNLVDAAKNYVRSMRAFGGTEHAVALKMALRMRPDVIFFLTDARIPRLSSSQLREIRHRAVESGTTIHAIEFGTEPSRPTDSFLIDLAGQNGGQYQYVDVRKL